MSMVKHKRGNASALSAQHEAELKALVKNQMMRLITATFPLRRMGSGLKQCVVSFSPVKNAGLCAY